MNLSKLAVMLLLLFILLSGCSPALATPGNQPGPKETVTQATPLSTETRLPASLTPAASLQGTGLADFLNTSIDLALTAFESVTVDGFLVLENRQTDKYLFYDMKNKRTIEIGQNHENTIVYAVSPNKKLMLVGVCPINKCDFSLQTVNQIIKTRIPNDDDWAVSGWLDDERVVFLSQIKPGQPAQPQNQVVYNVFTGEKISLELYLPNPQTLEIPGSRLDNLFVASVSPSLNRVFFSDQNDRLVLWNLDTQEEMASLPFALLDGPIRPDGWSPDSKQFATISPVKYQVDAYGKDIRAANELFVFEVEGNLTQLTHYNEKVPFATIFNPEWSPDNRHIAFWLTTGDDASRPKKLQLWLAVFDTVTLETRLYPSVSSTISSSIVWSPDGQQLIVDNWDSNLTLVDLARETKSAIPDTQDMMIWDWMAP